MPPLLVGLLVWLAVVAVLLLLFAGLGTWYFRSVMGFTSRRGLVVTGMLAIVLVGASFFFLPLVTLGMDLAAAQAEAQGTVGTIVAAAVLPLVKAVANMAQGVFLALAVAGVLLTAALVLIVVLVHREGLSKKAAVSPRKHVFEFRQDVFDQINKDFVGR